MISPFKVEEYIIRDISYMYPHTFEIIEGVFDNVFELLSSVPTSLIFGGIIRDIISGSDGLHDIDIVTTNRSRLDNEFLSSARWAPTVTPFRKNSGNPYKQMSLSGVTSFRNASGYVAQVLSYHNLDGTTNNLIKNTIESTDFICCGLIMDSEGNIFETIPGALEDAKNKQLRLNPYYKGIFLKSLFYTRLEKLTTRGWTLVTDMDKFKFSEEPPKPKKSKRPLVKEQSYTTTTHVEDAPVPRARPCGAKAYGSVRDSIPRAVEVRGGPPPDQIRNYKLPKKGFSISKKVNGNGYFDSSRIDEYTDVPDGDIIWDSSSNTVSVNETQAEGIILSSEATLNYDGSGHFKTKGTGYDALAQVEPVHSQVRDVVPPHEIMADGSFSPKKPQVAKYKHSKPKKNKLFKQKSWPY